MEKGIQLSNVSFGYARDKQILKDVTLAVTPGSFVGITGINGSGKSTLTYLFNGLIPHSIPGKLTGEVTVNGVSTREKRVSYFAHDVGMVFQNPDFSLFNLTVSEEIDFGLKHLKKLSDAQKVREALELVGLHGFENRDPQTLSYGQKQKACLASVLALDVSYIVLDEPTAMLDYKSSVELYKLFSKLNRQGKTIIVVEHDTDFLWNYADETVLIDGGSILAYGKTREVLSDHKQLSLLGIKIAHAARL